MKLRTFYILLAVIATLGSLAVYIATSQFGPGLSTDGARYLSTAESLAVGRGTLDYLGEPLVNWPPLYPALLAALYLLSGLDVMILAQIVNILAFGAIVGLSGIFFIRALPGHNTFALFASLVVATSVPLLEVSANVASDPLFMVSVLLWLLAAQSYVAGRSMRHFWQMVALAVVACFLRYAGSALVLSGTLAVLLTWRPRWRDGLWRAALYGVASSSPIALWVIFHNYRLSGLLLGRHRPSYPPGLFLAIVDKVVSWFVPGRILFVVPPLVILGLLLALLALRSRRARWAAFGNRLLTAPLLPAAVFTLVYGGILVFAISYSEHRVPGSQRLHAVLLPCLLVLGYTLYREFGPRLSGVWRTLALLAACAWLAFPLYRTSEYLQRSQARGDISFYNLYNTRGLRQSEFADHLSQLSLEPEDKVYSNNEAAAWFLLRRRIYRLPRYGNETQTSLESALLDFTGWPQPDEHAYLVWFGGELDYKRDVPTPEQMQAILPASRLSMLSTYQSEYGDVYIYSISE